MTQKNMTTFNILLGATIVTFYAICIFVPFG